MWRKLSEVLPRSGQTFLIEWDGSWQKATRWNDNIELWCLGEKHLVRLCDVLDSYLMDVPLIPGNTIAWLRSLTQA